MKIQKFIDDTGLAIAVVARKIGYTRAYLAAVINGTYPVTKNVIERMKKVYGIEIEHNESSK